MTVIKLLTLEEGFEYSKLTFNRYLRFLFTCGKQNIIAVGVESEEGMPLGLALACGPEDKDLTAYDPGHWYLCSMYVKKEVRGQRNGRRIWERFAAELKNRDVRKLTFQSVLREETENEMTRFFEAVGFTGMERIARIFRYSSENALKSSFVKASAENTLAGDDRFLFVSPGELSTESLEEMGKNDGNWYPEFVSPFIGWSCISKECSVFAVDRTSGKVAAWITAMDVNNKMDILYRTFFTREEYRSTPIGLLIFSEAVKRHYERCPKKKALASIPMNNERSMRFNELFFQGSYDHISYEICAEYFIK